MKMFKAAAAAAAMAAVMVGSGAANATTIYSDFTVDGASGGLGVASPYGEVKVDDASGSLAFTITLFDGLKFRNSNDTNHYAFAFNLGALTAANVSVGNISDNGAGTFTFSGGPVNESPFGSFALSMDCSSGCSTGYNVNSPSVLNFTVSKNGGSLSVADLTKDTNGYYFAADVVNTRGSTGNVGATSLTSAVPEPATWGMMLFGFGGLGAVMRRRRQTLAVA